MSDEGGGKPQPKVGCGGCMVMIVLGCFAMVSAISYLPQPNAPTKAQGPASSPSPSPTTKLSSAKDDKEMADLLAVNIILSGYGCYRVKKWEGDGLGGKNEVTCVERRGRSKLRTYRVDPIEGDAVMIR